MIFLTAIGIAVAFLLLVPSLSMMRKLAGYQTAVDLVASTYTVSTYATAGAASGLATAIFGAILISLSIRGIRLLFGYERFVVNGKDDFFAASAGLLTQGTRWVRSIIMALFRGGAVVKPEPLDGAWVSYPPTYRSLWSKAA